MLGERVVDDDERHVGGMLAQPLDPVRSYRPKYGPPGTDWAVRNGSACGFVSTKVVVPRRGEMRRTIRTVAVLAVVGLVAAACGEGGGTQASPTGGATGGAPKTKIGMVYDLVGRGDKSFNDAAYAGMIKAQNELHI